MYIAIEGPAAAGKSTLRDQLLARARDDGTPITHIGQFSWLSLQATRTLVALRAGQPGIPETTAIGAIIADLTLHTRYTITPALRHGHVVADRLVLSSACLLALLYGKPVDRYLDRLARTVDVLPDLTIEITTPPEINRDRLQQRATANRFADNPDNAVQLSTLYSHAGQRWAQITRLPIWRRALATPAAAERTATDVLNCLHNNIIGAHT